MSIDFTTFCAKNNVGIVPKNYIDSFATAHYKIGLKVNLTDGAEVYFQYSRRMQSITFRTFFAPVVPGIIYLLDFLYDYLKKNNQKQVFHRKAKSCIRPKTSRDKFN